MERIFKATLFHPRENAPNLASPTARGNDLGLQSKHYEIPKIITIFLTSKKDNLEAESTRLLKSLECLLSKIPHEFNGEIHLQQSSFSN